MRLSTKILFFGLLAISLNSCKKKDDCDTAASAKAVDTVASSGPDTTNALTGSQTRLVKRHSRKAEELTQYQIDSIKTERGALVTPPENTGASLTPGSGRATPKNNKVAPGTNASQGSSTGNVEVKN